MHQENLTGVDLNLLVALDALLTEKSVTEAGRYLGLSQPAMSHALRKLRDLFDDPLLTRVGRTMVLTPRAETLYPVLQETLRGVKTLLSGPATFDPATTTRRFTLACPDLLAPFLPEILQSMADSAPQARFHLQRPLGTELEQALAKGDVDLVLGAIFDGPDTLVSTRVGEVRWGVMMRAGHPLAKGRLTPKAWVRYPHVVVRTGDQTKNQVAGWLEAANLSRTVRVTVPTFLLVPYVLAQSDDLYTGPKELLEGMAYDFGLIVRSPPLALPPVDVSLLWHPRARTDPAHRWFREVVTDVTRAVLGSAKRA